MNYFLKTIALFLVLISFSANGQNKELLLNIKIQNATQSKIIFSYTSNSLTEDNSSFVLNVRSNGEVLTAISLDANVQFLKASYHQQNFEIFIGDYPALNFSFDETNVLKTLVFKDNGSAENNFLNHIDHQMNLSGKLITITKGHIFSSVDDGLYEKANESNNFSDYEKLLVRPTEKLNKNINQLVVDYLNIRNEYQYYTNLLTFFLTHQNDISKINMRRIAEENEVLKGIDFQVDFLLDYDFYTNFLQTYVYFMYLQGYSEESKAEFAMYDIANKFLKNESRDWVLCKILLNAHREQNKEIAEKKFFSLKQTATNKSFVSTVEDLYGNILSFNPDGAAPNFKLKDPKGKEIELHDFAGKVVYISFWATWCKPCLANFVKSEGIRNQLMDSGVILINICLDDTEDKWLQTMARIPMPGINLFASANTPLKLKYDLSRLPAYYIVDKAGNFAYLSESGNRDILSEFERLIKE
jgi:hypothetical protein